MSLKHGLLGFLNYKDKTGYELDKAFKESLHFFWQAQTSQIYRELNNMEKSGWLTSQRITQNDKPNKKIYSITSEGRAELDLWLSESNKNDGMNIRNAYLVKMFFSGEKSIDENVVALNDYINKCRDVLQNLANTENSIKFYSKEINDVEKAMYWGFTADYGELYFKMCIEWAEITIKKLEAIK